MARAVSIAAPWRPVSDRTRRLRHEQGHCRRGFGARAGDVSIELKDDGLARCQRSSMSAAANAPYACSPVQMTRAKDSMPHHVMGMYWGRRGLNRFAVEFARELLALPDIDGTFSVPNQVEGHSEFEALGDRILFIDTFAHSIGAVTRAWRIPSIRRRIFDHLRPKGSAVVIDLLPHIWSPFIVPTISASGGRYVPMAHDAVSHRGDYRSRAAEWSRDRSLRQADAVITLSDNVKETAGNWPSRRIRSSVEREQPRASHTSVTPT